MGSQLQDIMKQQQQQQSNAQMGSDEIQNDDFVQLVGFIVGSEEFAVPILSIQEIIKPIESTRVPFIEDFVLGVFNLRGNVLPLIDLRKKFGTGESKFDEDTRFMVMKVGDELAGFVIDKLTEALRMRESSILPPPDSSMGGRDALIEGIGRKDDRIITILKINSLLKRD